MKVTLLIISAFAAGLCYVAISRLAPDALALAVGIVLGVMAGIPTALLVLAARPEPEHRHMERATAGRNGYGAESVYLYEAEE